VLGDWVIKLMDALQVGAGRIAEGAEAAAAAADARADSREEEVGSIHSGEEDESDDSEAGDDDVADVDAVARPERADEGDFRAAVLQSPLFVQPLCRHVVLGWYSMFATGKYGQASLAASRSQAA
jgi:hypothetical protein